MDYQIRDIVALRIHIDHLHGKDDTSLPPTEVTILAIDSGKMFGLISPEAGVGSSITSSIVEKFKLDPKYLNRRGIQFTSAEVVKKVGRAEKEVCPACSRRRSR